MSCYISNNNYNYLLNQNYQYNIKNVNSDLINYVQILQILLQCCVLVLEINNFLNSQKKPSYNTNNLNSIFGSDPKYLNSPKINENFYISSFFDIDTDKDNKIQKNEFENFYIKQREKNNGIKYNNPNSSEFAKIKKEAENIYNAIKGNEENISKDRYSAFIDIIDETDGILDKKYYQNDAQNLINRIKNQPDSVIKGNKSLAQLIQEILCKNKSVENKIKDIPIKTEEEINAEKEKILVESAKKKFEEENYKGVIDDISKAITFNPDNYEYFEMRAKSYKELKDFDKAINDLKRAHELYIKEHDDKDRYMDIIEEYKQLKELNKPYTQRRDLEVEQVHQGEIGDCFLLATLAKHPEFIMDSGCLKWNDDGSVDVFFYDTEYKCVDNYWKYVAVGDKKCYHITKDELEKSEFELTKNNGEKKNVWMNPKQDFTLRAIEIGFLKACEFNYEKAVKNGGFLSKTIRMLYGNEKYKDMTYLCKPGKYSIDDLKNCTQVSIDRANDNDKERIINGKIIPTKHALIFNGYNPQTGMISISNPWGNNINSKEDDIEIPWTQFKDIFRIQLLSDKKSVHYEPLSLKWTSIKK